MGLRLLPRSESFTAKLSALYKHISRTFWQECGVGVGYLQVCLYRVTESTLILSSLFALTISTLSTILK